VTDDLIYANGVSGLTGDYLLKPMPPSRVAETAKERGPDAPDELGAFRSGMEAETFGPPFDRDPELVSDVGWAIVTSENEDPAIKEALGPLVAHRREAAGDELTKELDYREGERLNDWLARHGVAPGNLQPEKVPYYVLLVGSPERIPFSFQYLLDIEYAVGRLDFDEATDCAAYSTAVIEQETGGGARRERAATFFGTRHAFDRATQMSADSLVCPLAEAFGPEGRFAKAVAGYRIDPLIGEPATKDTLAEVLKGTGASGRPALLFSASHGMGGWPAGHPEQESKHGALLCQDWPGVGQIDASQYFAAADVPADADVRGMVAFFFACYGGGTPAVDAFERTEGVGPAKIAERPFTARLPRALLKAGALAVAGHVERAWGYSFMAGNKEQLGTFANTIGRSLAGKPVGHAMTDFNERYAALASSLLDLLDEIQRAGRVVPDAVVAAQWTERTDAQNYLLLGDPAVALRTA